MSKIICDICGTSYPESSKQCPICGCVRPGDVQHITEEVTTEGAGSAGYTHVKGGRFSKSNVKKRADSGREAPAPKPEAPRAPAERPPVTRTPAPRRPRNQRKQSNRGMAAAAILLLLVIIGVVIYIAVRFFGPVSDPGMQSTEPTVTIQEIPCKDFKVTDPKFEETPLNIGDGYLLDIFDKEPENTTDTLSFTSDNPAVATVSVGGKIEAVSAGEANITIKCGSVEKTIKVICVDPTATTEPTTPTEPTTTPTTEPTTGPEYTISLNRQDITLSDTDKTWDLYNGNAPKNLVKFSSDNEAVATFVNGKVTAMGRGTTTVHAEYNGQKLSCIVRCNMSYSAGTGVIKVSEYLNIREDAGAEFALLGTYGPNERVTITEFKLDKEGAYWGKTDKGWIHMAYVQMD